MARRVVAAVAARGGSPLLAEVAAVIAVMVDGVDQPSLDEVAHEMRLSTTKLKQAFHRVALLSGFDYMWRTEDPSRND
jgi:hypothetical protein